MEAWFTMASPSATTPSTGMALPMVTMARSPGTTSEAGTRTGPSWRRTQTASKEAARVSARLSRERLRV